MAESSWPDDQSPHVFHHSVEEALNISTRLLAFTNSHHYSQKNEISHRELGLFFGDLTNFALHVRKIGELTGLKEDLKDLKIIEESETKNRVHEDEYVVFEKKFWTIINKIIHSKKMKVVEERDITDFPALQRLDSLFDNRSVFYRFCVVRSDEGKTVHFLIEALILAFLERVWMNSKCQEMYSATLKQGS